MRQPFALRRQTVLLEQQVQPAWVDALTRVERRSAGSQHVRDPGRHHAGELADLDGSTIDRLRVEPALELELDLGWAWIAEVDPLALLEGAAPGVPLVHLKDFLRHDSDSCCPIGEGAMGWDELLPPVAAVAGVEWLVVEQDEPAGDELDEAARSLASVNRFLGR